MAGGLKAGLLFGAIALVVVAGLTIIPTAGILCCGPLGTLLLGGLAGYFGVRWSETPRIVQGVLGGGLSGFGALIGTIIGVVLLFAIARTIPELNAELQRQIEETMQQQGTGSLTQEEMDLFLGLAPAIAGTCLGVLNLLFALGAGALGGWLGARQLRGAPQPPLTMPPANT
jgi:hypothetical protein